MFALWQATHLLSLRRAAQHAVIHLARRFFDQLGAQRNGSTLLQNLPYLKQCSCSHQRGCFLHSSSCHFFGEKAEEVLLVHLTIARLSQIQFSARAFAVLMAR